MSSFNVICGKIIEFFVFAYFIFMNESYVESLRFDVCEEKTKTPNEKIFVIGQLAWRKRNNSSSRNSFTMSCHVMSVIVQQQAADTKMETHAGLEATLLFFLVRFPSIYNKTKTFNQHNYTTHKHKHTHGVDLMQQIRKYFVYNMLCYACLFCFFSFLLFLFPFCKCFE